jgi:hypothetical protein
MVMANPEFPPESPNGGVTPTSPPRITFVWECPACIRRFIAESAPAKCPFCLKELPLAEATK